MTQGCYQAIAEAGLRIPEDILVAGHDNQMLANEMVPLCLLDAPNEIHKATHDSLSHRGTSHLYPALRSITLWMWAVDDDDHSSLARIKRRESWPAKKNLRLNSLLR